MGSLVTVIYLHLSTVFLVICEVDGSLFRISVLLFEYLASLSKFMFSKCKETLKGRPTCQKFPSGKFNSAPFFGFVVKMAKN